MTGRIKQRSEERKGKEGVRNEGKTKKNKERRKDEKINEDGRRNK
jgi:hypothetical protein